ncbi:ProQ/FINO family protein [Rickettsia endosymbiont of Pantilius tunicatus]|uniref:ProQ/FINO family protein n=1 Tax=Rickettsia endosymbiont of Pantilius tunicatus TaxID=3066267 RepID=UPI00376EE8A1
MNTVANTERPKLKLNLATKPITLNTNASSLVAGSPLKKVVVFENPNRDIKDVSAAATKAKVETLKKSKKQAEEASNKKAANQKVVAVVATPEEILKEKIKSRKKEYFSILTKLKADFPAAFSEDPKPLAIGIDLELKKILNRQFPNNQLNRFFHKYCGSFKYKEKLIEGAQRFNLDGLPATLVTQKEVPVIIHKPKNVANAAKTVSNEIDSKQ